MKQSKRSRNTRKSPVLAALTLACAITFTGASTNAYASDAPAFGQRLAEFIQTALRYGEEVQRWVQTAQHYKQQISELGNIVSNAQLALTPHPMENASERSLSYGMERCDRDATDSGLSLSSLITSLIPGNKTYVEEQHDLCRKIVLLENYKFNDLVKAMKELKKLKEEGHYKVVNEANSATTQSKNDASTVAAINTLTAVQIQYANIEYTTKLYDDMIASLNEQIKTKANEALSGKKKSLLETFAGAAISSGVMATALEAQKTDCPWDEDYCE